MAIDTPIKHRTQAGDLDSDGWCVAKSTRGNFSVALPGRFDDYFVKSKKSTGGIIVLHYIETKDANGTEFKVLQTEYLNERPPPTVSQVESMMERVEDMGVKVSRRAVTIGSLGAERLSARAPDVSVEVAFLVGASSDYIMSVQWEGQAAEGFDEDVERFFSSFKVTTSDE
jgi:hypothetical protein